MDAFLVSTAPFTGLIALPVWPFLLAALLCLFLPAAVRSILCVLAPALSAWFVFALPDAVASAVAFETLQMLPSRVDGLGRAFALGFGVAGTLAALYAWSERQRLQQVAFLLYAGAAVGAVLAGDLVTLFAYWEVTALASAFLVLARGSEGAYHTGLRYLTWQIGSGVLLVAGLALHVQAGGATDMALFDPGPWTGWSVGVWAILGAIGIKGAFPFLHTWMKDAYPAATPAGTVILSIFTTKMAVYAMLRLFPGAEPLVWVGMVMAVFPIPFALAADDLRRSLAYVLITQLGLMTMAAGIGTPAAVDGATAHALAGMVYFALLFMVLGTVLSRTGTARASLLGGLAGPMPWLFLACVVGALTIAALPLTSGYVSKTHLLAALQEAGRTDAWLAGLVASVGALLAGALRLPLRVFLGPVQTPARPMAMPGAQTLALAGAAALCLLFGVVPTLWDAILPAGTELKVYKPLKIVHQLELMAVATLVFLVTLRLGWLMRERTGIVLDTDWLYRRAGLATLGFAASFVSVVWAETRRGAVRAVDRLIATSREAYRPGGRFGSMASTGTMVLWLAVLLCAALAVNLLDIR